MRASNFLKMLVLAAGLAACGDDDPMPPGPGPNIAGSPASTIVVPPPPTKSTLTLINRYTNVTITGLYVSPTTRESWGSNQLSQAVSPGGTSHLHGIPCAASYDLKVTLTLGPALFMRGVNLRCGSDTVMTVP